MTLAEMQSCLARLYTELSFQQLFFMNPDLSLSNYNLSPEETLALKQLNQTQLKRFAYSLINKSQEKFEANYPLIYQCAGEKCESYYFRFYNMFRPQTDELYQPQLLAFGKFLEQCLNSDPAAASYLGQLTRYEWQHLNARFKADYKRHLPSQDGPIITLANRPQLAPGVTIEEYRYDITSLAQAVEQNQEILEPTPGNFIFLVYLPPRKAQPQTIELNPASRTMLEYCDGTLTVSEITGKLEQYLGKSDLAEMVV